MRPRHFLQCRGLQGLMLMQQSNMTDFSRSVKICGMRHKITPQLAAHADVLLWLLAAAPLECAAGAPPLPSA